MYTMRLDEQIAHANALIRVLESEHEAINAMPAALLREVFGSSRFV